LVDTLALGSDHQTGAGALLYWDHVMSPSHQHLIEMMSYALSGNLITSGATGNSGCDPWCHAN